MERHGHGKVRLSGYDVVPLAEEEEPTTGHGGHVVSEIQKAAVFQLGSAGIFVFPVEQAGRRLGGHLVAPRREPPDAHLTLQELVSGVA